MPLVTSAVDWSLPTYEDVCRAHHWSIPERLNIADVACRRHADGANRLALIEIDARSGVPPDEWEARRTTFDELDDRSRRLAMALGELGVERGDRVAVFLPQRGEAALAHLAAFTLGAISVPLSPLFRADALRHRLSSSGARVLVTDTEHYEFVRGLRAELPRLTTVLCCDGVPPGTESFEATLRTTTVRAEPVDTGSDEPAMLVYTSGTSGLPKGALHAHRFLPGRLSGFELIHALEQQPSVDRPFWTPADWAWIGGLVDCVLTPWVFGCPVLAFHRRGFDPYQTFELLLRARVRSLFLPPTAMHKLRKAEESAASYDFGVFSVHTAGEPLPADTYRWAAKTFGRVFELYGMTEVGALVGSSPYFDVRPGAMGKPYPGHDVVLLDGQRVVEGVGEGEIAVRRGDPGLFLGYWEDEEGTAARFRGDFFVTGDVARRDEDGYLWYLGRDDDMFNTSGYRVGPTDVEATLMKHPAVLEAAVVGVPDEERGRTVKAFVILRPGFPADEAMARQIQRFVKSELAAYEYPRQLVFARDLPRTVTGKIRRAELRTADADRKYGSRPAP